MGWFRTRRVRRTGPDRYAVRLAPEERALLAALAGDLRSVLEETTDEPHLRRLFPTAYNEDPERDREYQQLARDELLSRRLAALDATIATAEAEELDAAGLGAWMGAINDLRLVIGTALDVSEDDGPFDRADPRAGDRAVYAHLTGLLDDVVDALADGLPDAPAPPPPGPADPI